MLCRIEVQFRTEAQFKREVQLRIEATIQGLILPEHAPLLIRSMEIRGLQKESQDHHVILIILKKGKQFHHGRIPVCRALEVTDPLQETRKEVQDPLQKEAVPETLKSIRGMKGILQFNVRIQNVLKYVVAEVLVTQDLRLHKEKIILEVEVRHGI